MPIRMICLLFFCLAGCQYNVSDQQQPSDYHRELVAVKASIETAQTALTKQANEKDAFRLIFHQYSYAGLTGNYADFKAVEKSLQAAYENYGASKQLLQFSANFNFKMHRLAAAKSDLAACESFGGGLSNEILKADIAQQQGRYAVTGQAYEAIAEQAPSWDNLARLAYFKLHTGFPEQADQLYQQAQNKLSVKQMRHFAWLELQRGIIDLESQRFQQALEHYLRADQAYSGYWLIHEHIAEVSALLGDQDEAITIYKQVIANTDSPEFVSALATLYQADNDPEAEQLFARADALFEQQYQLFPEAAVGHYVESLLARKRIDSKLVDYAEKNHQWRSNAQSKYLLARAYQKSGNIVAAKNLMSAVIESPWRTRAIYELASELNI